MRGVNSLARAFSLAGAKSLLATLDEVPYQSGLQLMEAFYQYLAQGIPKDKALYLAKRDYIAHAESGLDALPSRWANYVLIGTISPVFLDDVGPYNLTWIIIALICLGLFSIFLLTRISTD